MNNPASLNQHAHVLACGLTNPLKSSYRMLSAGSSYASAVLAAGLDQHLLTCKESAVTVDACQRECFQVLSSISWLLQLIVLCSCCIVQLTCLYALTEGSCRPPAHV